jgi:hypothetical protein
VFLAAARLFDGAFPCQLGLLQGEAIGPGPRSSPMAPSINFRCWSLVWPGSRLTGFVPAAGWGAWTVACDHRPFHDLLKFLVADGFLVFPASSTPSGAEGICRG